MPNLRRIVLDVLKPNEPSIIEMASLLEELPGVHGVDITVKEVDRRVEKIKITLIGEKLDYHKVKNVVEKSGGSIHSVDRASAGRKPVAF